MANDADDIIRYRKGLMSDRERHAFEKRALSDPFLADALEEAGFDNPHLLQNYRDPNAHHSGGSWIFRKAGFQ